MTLRERFRGWRRRRRWNGANRRQNPPLREFVYLDDVSVYSLYASRKGPIATQLTETEAKSLQSEVTSSIGVKAIVNAEVGSRIQEQNSQGTQVLRKAIIQTTFKDLYDLEQSSLVLRPVSAEGVQDPFKTIGDLRSAAKSEKPDPRLIAPALLVRGALVELEVVLEAEPIFRAGAVMSSVLDIIQDNPEMYGSQILAGLAEANAVNQLIEKLLGGLVPVRGMAVDYEVAEIDGKDWIVHRNSLEQLDRSACRVRPLYLTAVAEQSLFWKDIRRVLFAGSSYRVLARLASDGLKETWTPVKLVDVLRSVAPEVAAFIESANSGVLAAMTRPPVQDEAISEMMEAALVSFGLGLADSMGESLDPNDLANVAHGAVVANQSQEAFRSVIPRRLMFAPVIRYLEDRYHRQVDRTTAADCRTAALIEAGFTLEGQVATRSPDAGAVGGLPRAEERFLDSELVAIYW